MKKRIFVGFMAVMMLVSLMAPAAFAASTEVVEEPGKTVYSMTVNLEDVLSTGGSAYKNVNLGLVLDPATSGWSPDAVAKFTTLPANAKVENIEINPGTVTINAGNSNFLGAVVVTRLHITSPQGKLIEMTFDKKSMKTMAFYGESAKGNWTLSMYGQNLTRPTGDMLDPLRLGSVQYKSAKITIYYTLE